MATEEQSELTPAAMNAVPAQIPPSPPPLSTESPQRMMGRPVSVIVIAVLFFIWTLTEFSSIILYNDADDFRITSGTISLVFCAIDIYVGKGLLHCRSIARVGAIITLIGRYITLIALSIWVLGDIGKSEPLDATILGVVSAILLLLGLIFGVQIYVLTRHVVKAACSR